MPSTYSTKTRHSTERCTCEENALSSKRNLDSKWRYSSIVMLGSSTRTRHFRDVVISCGKDRRGYQANQPDTHIPTSSVAFRPPVIPIVKATDPRHTRPKHVEKLPSVLHLPVETPVQATCEKVSLSHQTLTNTHEPDTIPTNHFRSEQY